MLYKGLDLHKSFSYITTMDGKGKIVGQKKLPSNGEVVEFLKEFDETMEVAIEATPSWYWLYDLLEGEGFDVKLSHPHSHMIKSLKVLSGRPMSRSKMLLRLLEIYVVAMLMKKLVILEKASFWKQLPCNWMLVG